MNIVDKARALATLAHDGQVRKYTGEPYITHPEAVSRIVQTVTDDEQMIAAALLHDVLEDTYTKLEDIVAIDPVVCSLVMLLTDLTSSKDGTRAEQKMKYLTHLGRTAARVQTLKLADIIDNTATIVERDPEFARTYLLEKAALLRVLTLGHPDLYRTASAQVYQGLAALGM